MVYNINFREEILFNYLEAMGALSYISLDMSLARGLDYYTGVIYEAVLTTTDQVGSIAAGGRYDRLVGMFSPKQVPAVGVSIGIERILTIVEQRERQRGLQKSRIQVLVAAIGGDFTCERMKVCRDLWKAELAAEFVPMTKPTQKRQLNYALDQEIPFVVFLGEDELARDVVGVKCLATKEQIEVSRDQLVEYLQKQLGKTGV